MNQNVIYVGIDVDDERYHGSALDKCTGEALDFQCRATLKGLVQQVKKVQQYFGGLPLKLCYEASYVGFSLQRDLRKRGFDCEVVAPSSIPRRAGKPVKTDRIDARELAEFYANDLLTIVSAPELVGAAEACRESLTSSSSPRISSRNARRSRRSRRPLPSTWSGRFI